MSDIAKWALLAAAAVLLIGLISALPFVEFINVGELSSLITDLVEIAGDSFTFGRGLVNNFLTPFGRTILSGVIIYFVGKWVITMGIKISAWVYHFIFK